ncbi:MAG TPA: molybdenum cofactor guanylyltransferase [Anaerolineales bacterium]|nr:molybdenum cofactor guanylyltransferase [Anaerolineales bacterium]
MSTTREQAYGLQVCVQVCVQVYYNHSMISVAIQAGGQSRRMGQDKGLLLLQGKPLITRVLARVAFLADEILVTTNQLSDYQFLSLPLYPDLFPGTGALGGLYTALHAAQEPLVAVVACDMPFVNPAILELARDRLLETGVDVAIPRTDEGYEPFHAVYRKEACLPAVEKALQAGERRLISWFADVQVLTLEEALFGPLDPQGLAFWNLNTPEEFQHAELLIASGG